MQEHQILKTCGQDATAHIATITRTSMPEPPSWHLDSAMDTDAGTDMVRSLN